MFVLEGKYKSIFVLCPPQAEVWNVDFVARVAGAGPVTSKDMDAGGVMVIEPSSKRKDDVRKMFLILEAFFAFI